MAIFVRRANLDMLQRWISDLLMNHLLCFVVASPFTVV